MVELLAGIQRDALHFRDADAVDFNGHICLLHAMGPLASNAVVDESGGETQRRPIVAIPTARAGGIKIRAAFVGVVKTVCQIPFIDDQPGRAP